MTLLVHFPRWVAHAVVRTIGTRAFRADRCYDGLAPRPCVATKQDRCADAGAIGDTLCINELPEEEILMPRDWPFPPRVPSLRRIGPCLIVLAVACSDSAPAPAPTAVSLPSPLAVIEPVDGDVNPNDTYVLFDEAITRQTTVTLAEPVYDPVSDQMQTTLTLTSPTEYAKVEGGYDYSSRIRVNNYRQGDSDPYTQTLNAPRTVKAIRSAYTEYGTDGQILPAESLDGAPSTSPMASLGDLTYAQITNGFLIDENSEPDGPRYSGGATGANVYTHGTGGAVERVERPDPGTLRITATLFDHVDGRGRQLAEARRQYKKRDRKWVLEELAIVAEASASEGTIRHEQVRRFSNMYWHENIVKDAERKVAREAAVGAGPPVAQPRSAIGAAIPIRSQRTSGPQFIMMDCEQYIDPPPECDGGGDEPPPPPPPYTGPVQNVVFQHGIFSNAATWDRMDPWLSSDFYLGNEADGTKIKRSLSSTSRLSSQTDDLLSSMSNTGKQDFALIGHSQGGLIARAAAQRRPDLAEGVVTISSPHHGALLARNSKIAIQNLLTGLLDRLYSGCSFPQQDPGCFIAVFLAQQAVPGVVNWGIDQSVPVNIDLQPNNAFVNALNQTPEAFTRVGIENYADKRWVLSRLAGDYFCNPDASCGGRRAVAYTRWAYSGFNTCWIVASLLGYYQQAYWCAYIAGSMNSVDQGWDRLTAPGQRSDGIVNGNSQIYPNAMRRLSVFDADSHVGETKSDKVRSQLRTTLLQNFSAPSKF